MVISLTKIWLQLFVIREDQIQRMKIVTIIGARPQFVKAAVLSREFEKHNTIEEVIVHTGQHFDQNMSDVFFEEMGIPKPLYNLEVNNLGHGAMTGRMLEGIESVLAKERPDLLLVYGDTNSTLAGALAARKMHIKVAHVEAGLRSFNMEMPEEVNRILTDRISDFLLCPTDIAVQNLKNEGFDHFGAKFVKTGDVMQDAANYYAVKASEKSGIMDSIEHSNYILATLHRAENTNDKERLKNITDALNIIHETICPVVIPLHPGTKQKMENFGLRLNVKQIEPVGYFDMIELIRNAQMVMTDSGGLQKEAYFFSKNCVTLRDQTEWVELVEQDVNRLAGANMQDILDTCKQMFNKHSDFTVNLYGNGQAASNSVQFLLDNVNV